MAQLVKNPPAVQETWVWSLGWVDPLEEGMATQSSILAWRVPMDRRAWQATVQATVHGITKYQTRLSDYKHNLITHVTAWALSPVRSAVVLYSHRSMNPSVNCTCEGSRLLAPYENHLRTISSNPPSLWKNCLPRNQSLVPERLGTAAVDHLKCLSHTQAETKSLPGLMIGGVLSTLNIIMHSLNHYFIEYLVCARHCFAFVF